MPPDKRKGRALRGAISIRAKLKQRWIAAYTPGAVQSKTLKCGRFFTTDSAPPEVAVRFANLEKGWAMDAKTKRSSPTWTLQVDGKTISLSTLELTRGPCSPGFTVKVIGSCGCMPPRISKTDWHDLLDNLVKQMSRRGEVV